MCDLRTDAVPLGNSPILSSETPQPPPNPVNKPRQVFNITGSKDVHIGPVFHNVSFTPKPQTDPKDMPLKKDVEALLRCHREIEDRDKYIVGEHLGGSWKSLGRSMGFSSGQLENMEADHSRNADRVNELISRWHDKESDRATVSKLSQFVLDVKAFHVLKYLKP